MTELDLLRKQLCRQRQDLPPATRATASAAIVQRIRHLPLFQHARHVAVYSAIRGEVDLEPLWHAAPAARQWYLPAIDRGPERTMQFVCHKAAAVLKENGYGIPEPDTANATALDPRELDLVLTPLVAFDAAGHRIGMGAGYYDRAFSFLLDNPPPTRPKLIGIGYEFQRVEMIDAQPWDVPLWGVVTEQAIYGRLKEGEN